MIDLKLSMSKKINFFTKKLNKFKKSKALILENGKTFTYKDLITNSLRISRTLDTSKRLVFLLGQNNFETIIGYISFVNQGFAVALLDHRINDIFLKRLVSKYNPKYIFCERDKLKKDYHNILNFKSYVLMQNKKIIDYNIDKELMLLMSTSGSTGSPKLVKQSYQNILINSQSIIKYLNIKSRDITITTLPISYVYGLSVINTHLFSGAQIILTNRSMVENNFWKLIKKFKVNNFSGVPYNYSIIEKILKSKVPPSIKYSTQAGGKMNHLLIKNIIEIYKKNKIKFFQMYGAAEATSRMSYLDWKYADKKIGSIGKAIPGGSFFLRNDRGQKITRSFKKGELVYKGKNVFMGYAKNVKDLSLPDTNNGILKTGDVAYFDKKGFYYIVGRKNRYCKIYGVRIDLSELEKILLEQGIDTIMKEGGENKIIVYAKNIIKTKKKIKQLSKLTSINLNVFIIKTFKKKNLTNNFKYKI